MKPEMLLTLQQSFMLLGIGMFVLFIFMGLMVLVLQGLEKVVGVFYKKK